MSLKYQLFKAVGVDPNAKSTKLTQVQPILGKEKGKFQVLKYGAAVFVDTMYMRKDPDGYQYVLTVVDVATRRMDAIAMIGRKASDVIQAFDKIFERGYITDDIKTIYSDPGSEFKNNEFKEYLNAKNINLRHTMTARKSQSAIVEYFNHLISRAINTRLTTIEIEYKEEFYHWHQYLDNIVEVLNKNENKKQTNKADFFKEPRTTLKELDDRLKVGDIVHVRLQQPKDHMLETNNKLHGGFRNGDLRFEQDTTEIANVLLLPNQPIRYIVKKYNNVSFGRKELLLA